MIDSRKSAFFPQVSLSSSLSFSLSRYWTLWSITEPSVLSFAIGSFIPTGWEVSWLFTLLFATSLVCTQGTPSISVGTGGSDAGVTLSPTNGFFSGSIPQLNPQWGSPAQCGVRCVFVGSCHFSTTNMWWRNVIVSSKSSCQWKTCLMSRKFSHGNCFLSGSNGKFRFQTCQCLLVDNGSVDYIFRRYEICSLNANSRNIICRINPREFWVVPTPCSML